LLAPLNVSLQIFPLHLRPHKFGSADSEIQQLCAQIIDQLASNQSINLTFVSVDRDAGYQSLFDHQFNLLFPLTAPTADLCPILQAMREFRSRQIGDFLHFLKNALTRIYIREQFTMFAVPSTGASLSRNYLTFLGRPNS
jgi:hypothetical protein